MPKDEIPNGYAATALDQNIVRQFLAGYGVVSGCAPSDGASGMEVDVASGTAWHNGGRVSVAGGTVTLSNGDSNPRKDLVYVDGTGSLQVIEGTPAAISDRQAGDTAFDLFKPAPPDMTSVDGVLIAEVFVAAGATTLDSADVRDRRITSDAAFDALTAYNLTVQDTSTFQAGATFQADATFDAATVKPPTDAVQDLLDLDVSSTPAAGTETSYTAAIDGSGLLKWYAEADGAGGIQNASVRALVNLIGMAGVETRGDVVDDVGNVVFDYSAGHVPNGTVEGLVNFAGGESFNAYPIQSGDIGADQVTQAKMNPDVEVHHVVDSPNGHIPTALLEDTESAEISVPVPSGETLKVYRWGVYKISDGTAPTGLEAQLLDGGDTIQASASTVNSESTDPATPVASYNNGTTSLSIFKLRAKNSTGNNYATDGVGAIFGYIVE